MSDKKLFSNETLSNFILFGEKFELLGKNRDAEGVLRDVMRDKI
jgi:hypothetical protein